MTVTVAEMRQRNNHVARLPDAMLKHDHSEISPTERNVHAVAHGTLYAGIPASTIPGVLHDPYLFGVSAVIGGGAGAIARIVVAIINPTTKSYLENWGDWLVHSAAMNTISKAALGTLHASGITANTVVGYMNNHRSIVVMCEGAIAGGFAGYEVASLMISTIQPGQPRKPIDNNSQSPSATTEEKQPLVEQTV